jgi:hypothetical protein
MTIVNVSVTKKAVKLEAGQVTWVPRHIAAKLSDEYAIISIESLSEDRPVFHGNTKVLKVLNGIFVDTVENPYEQGRDYKDIVSTEFFHRNQHLQQHSHASHNLLDFNMVPFLGEHQQYPIVVHCEMGVQRSQRLARWISRELGYKLIDGPVILNTVDGEVIKVTPRHNF